MRIVFMGTPEFSVPTLQALVDAGHDVACVYSQPPRPAGRGKRLRPSPVSTRAAILSLVARCPASLRDGGLQADFAEFRADVAVVAAYGLLLPAPILVAPHLGCLNIHASLLPRWRGAAPIHRAVMAGDTETGLCIMQMDEGLDTGPVLIRKKTPVGAEETAGELHDRLSRMGAQLIVEALDGIGGLQAIPQSDVGVTYAGKIDKAEAMVDWGRPATEVDALIRGLSPVPGAWASIGGERLKLLRSRRAKGSGAPGKVLHGLTIACGEGSVEVLEVQRPGRRAARADEFLRGFQMPGLLK